MKTEYGEVEEPVPAGTIGSSTMPQKRNPQLCQDVIGMSAEVRSLVPLALETMISEHEADNQPSVMFDMLERGCSLMGEVLTRVHLIVAELRLNPERMRANLLLSGGTISAEAIMLGLGGRIGRQEAHEVVYEAAQRAATEGVMFLELLRSDPRVTAHLSAGELERLLEPEGHIGLSAQLAREQAEGARHLSDELLTDHSV
jgi:3-carboxy-cis,cis-muconate cycloisomerase